jgi:hypothetical protein
MFFDFSSLVVFGSIATPASTTTASDVLRARMWHGPGYLGLCLFPVHNISDTVAVYVSTLVSLSPFLFLLFYYFFLSFTNVAGIPSNPPPSIWDTQTSPIIPNCGVCLDVLSPELLLPTPTPHERQIIHKVLEIWNIPSPKPYQVEVIACLCFSLKRRLYLVRKTGDGKSAVDVVEQEVFLIDMCHSFL